MAFVRHVQLSWVVWHRKWVGLGVCMVQCLCSVSRMCCRSVVILGWVTVRRVEQRVLTRCAKGVRAEGRCVRIQVWMARWYPRTKIPQSKLLCWVGRVWCVDGDVRVSVREELVGVGCAGSPCPEVPEVLFEVRVFVIERV